MIVTNKNLFNVQALCTPCIALPPPPPPHPYLSWPVACVTPVASCIFASVLNTLVCQGGGKLNLVDTGCFTIDNQRQHAIFKVSDITVGYGSSDML